mgnify:CR=1 FL=1|jgi:hypothetical protein
MIYDQYETIVTFASFSCVGGDTIHIDHGCDYTGDLPRIFAESDPNYVKHVNCNGSRDHVLSYRMDSGGECFVRCSCKDCIMNK